MSSLLHLVRDINNRMIAYERKGNASSLSPGASSSSTVLFRNTNENPFQPNSIMSRSWCNFYEENHEERTCEVKKNARDKIFGKRPDTTIDVLDWVELEDVMIINNMNKSYTAKGKYDPPCTYSSPSLSLQIVGAQAIKTLENQGAFSPLPSYKYNILNQLANIKVDATLLDIVFVPEQQNHLKHFMEGKISTIANIFEESKEEDSTVNKIGVNHFRNLVKKPFLYLYKNYG
jgi:hypothetical protein